MSDRAAAAKAFESEIPGAWPLQRHFFERLTTADWLPHLARKGLLDAPPAMPEEPGGTRYMQWPAGDYLLRMAALPDAAARLGVAKALQNVAASENPDVQYHGFEILGALPPEESAPLVDVAVGWLGRETRFGFLQEPEKFVIKLARGKKSEAALRVAGALLQIWEQGGRIATLYGQHMYEHHMPAIATALTEACGEDGLCFVRGLLIRAGAIGDRIEYDHHSGRSIDDDQAANYDPFNALVSAVRRSADILVARDPSRMGDIVAILTSHPAKLFLRLALHLLAQNPSAAPDLAEKYLLEADLIEATWCQPEYAALARTWYPSLSPPQQEAVLRVVDSMPGKYLAGWRDSFEQTHKKSPSLENERIFAASIVRDALWSWRSVLPRERQDALARIAEELGDPKAWREALFPPEESPIDGAEFSTRPIEEIVAFLKTWKPQGLKQRQTVTALAQELRTAVGNKPRVYAKQADQFIGLKPIYVRRVLEALLSEASNRGDFEWAKVLDLIAFTYSQFGQKIDSATLSEGDDKDWTWACMTAGELLAAGLRRGAEGIPFEHAARVRSLVLTALGLAPAHPELEDFEDRFRRSTYFAAQSTLRGLAVELCILLMFWLSKDTSTPVGAAPRDALQNLPDIRRALEAQLADLSNDGRVPRAIIGRHLHRLFYFGEAWLKEQMPLLLPTDDAELRRAAWRSHLSHDGGPLNPLMTHLRGCYAEDIQLLGSEADRDFRDFYEQRLTEYTMILQLWGVLPDDLLRQFWRDARADVRRHAMWFVAEQISRPASEVPDDVKARGRAYWERRLAEAAQSDDPDEHRAELGAISQLCFHGQVDELWLCDQLLRMLEAGFVPTDAFSVVAWLGQIAPRHVDRAVEVLSALLRNPLIERGAYLTQREPIRAVLSGGIAQGTSETVSLVHETVGILSALGESSYLDFVRPPAEE